jgi:hypothetical protein
MDFIRIYEFYKVTFNEQKGDNKYGDCPFIGCEKENHFSVNVTNGLYRCLKCGMQGNVFAFLTELHKQYLDITPLQKYKELGRERSVLSKTLQTAGLAYDENWNRWLVSFKDKGTCLNNLGVFWPGSSNPYRILKAPELPIKLYRPFDNKRFTEDIHAFEGEWDLWASKSAFSKAGMKAPSLISTSGATTWTPDMNKAVKGKNVVFFFNQDKGGEDGKKLVTKRAKGFTYSFAGWSPDHDPETINDVRDLWKTSKDKASVALTLMDMANSPQGVTIDESGTNTGNGQSHFRTSIEDIEPVESYDQWLSVIKEHLYLNESMRRTYEFLVATSLSVHLPDKPLWSMVVGAASTGKSTALDSLGGTNEYFEYASKVTSESFVSGMSKGEVDEISLMANIDRKTLVIGDLTGILSLPILVQQKLWGLLKEAYGGVLKVTFGNQAPKEYYGKKFCMIAGVTHAIYNFNESDMGERFVKIDFAGRDFDEDAQMDQAMMNQDNWPEIEKILRENMLGYLRHLHNNTDFTTPPQVGTETEERIKMLAKLATKLRTKVSKDRFEGMIARPVAESPTRFALQLKTIAKGLMWAKQEEEVTTDIYETLQKVAFDSCPGLALECINYIHKVKACSINTLVNRLQIPKTRVHQIIVDFCHLNILEKCKVNNGSGQRGRDASFYQVSETIQGCLDNATPKKQSRFSKLPRRKVTS